MRRTIKRIQRTKKGSGMVTGGCGVDGPYGYTGVKKGKTSVGVSAGTRGRELHASHRTKEGKIQVRFNLETKRLDIKRSRSRRRR